MKLTHQDCDCESDYVFWSLGNQQIKTCKSCGRDIIIQEESGEREPEES